MKICFPVQKDEGLASIIYNHFGSAPLFLIVDTATSGISTVKNRDQDHVHGACNPVKALDNQNVDAVVVGGIGAGALNKLNQMGIRVHLAQSGSIAENVTAMNAGRLPELTLQGCCGGHDKGGGCAH